MFELVLAVTDGLAIGGIYAALALALVLVYRTTGILNFAQGEIGTVGTFVVWSLIAVNLPIWAAIPIGLALAFIGGALIERVLIRPIQNIDPVLAVKNTLGIYLVCNGATAIIFGADLRDFPSIFGNKSVLIADVPVSYAAIGMIATILIAVLCLYLLLQKTEFGLSLRAAASNPVSSELSGINTARMFGFGWGLAAMMATLSGVLVAPILLLDHNLLVSVLVYAFAAIVLGGFDSLPGAVLGGFLIGLSETFAAVYLPVIGTDFKILVPLTLVMILLIFKPWGLFGKAEERKV